VFGISFGEALLLVLIAIVVVGPRDLPGMMRSLGRNISKLRRTANDLRSQSGIDEILQNEGIHREIQDLQKLATGRIMELGLHEPLMSPGSSATRPRPADPGGPGDDPYTAATREPPRRREYPPGGPDSYDALPEDAALYQEGAMDTDPLPSPGAATSATASPEAAMATSPAPAVKPSRPVGPVARGELPPDDESSAA
jgi:sec-independent protein translocase protein TatB